MHPQQIKLILAKLTPRILYDLLIQHFAWEKSPDYPVYVYYKVALRRTKYPELVDGMFHSFRVGEATGDENYPTRELAQIIVQSDPPLVVLVIRNEGKEREISREDWAKVESLARKIIAKIQQSGFQVVSVEPKGLSVSLDRPDSIRNSAENPSLLLPKTEKKLNNWRKAYAIILARRAAYLEEFKDSVRKKRGRNADYQAAIAHEMGWVITDRTLRNIIKAGEAGLLD